MSLEATPGRRLVGQLVGWLVGHTVRFLLCRRLWTVTERPQRLATFETFDQSDELRGARGVWRPKCFAGWFVWRLQCSSKTFTDD